MIAASVIAVIAARLRIPYRSLWFWEATARIVSHANTAKPLRSSSRLANTGCQLIIFLLPLLFEGSLKIQFRHMRESLIPICPLASIGVLAATLISGFALHWALGIPVLVALVFGAIMAATDLISVLAIFEDIAVDKRLTIIAEGESLFNAGTAVVLYGILF